MQETSTHAAAITSTMPKHHASGITATRAPIMSPQRHCPALWNGPPFAPPTPERIGEFPDDQARRTPGYEELTYTHTDTRLRTPPQEKYLRICVIVSSNLTRHHCNVTSVTHFAWRKKIGVVRITYTLSGLMKAVRRRITGALAPIKAAALLHPMTHNKRARKPTHCPESRNW